MMFYGTWASALEGSSSHLLSSTVGPEHHYLSLCGQNEVRVPEHMHPRTAAVNSTAQRATVANRQAAHAVCTMDNEIALT